MFNLIPLPADTTMLASESEMLEMQIIRPGERFYGDDGPHWYQGRNDQPAETAADALYARDLAVKRLRSEAETSISTERSQACARIAEQIEGCGPGRRCLHEACPLCNRARQRWFVWTARVAANKAKKRTGDELVVISIIPNLRLKLGASREHIAEQLTRFITMLRRGLEQAGVTFAVGGIDISVNQARRGRRARHADHRRPDPRVQLHLWAICLERNARDAERELRRAFGRSATVHRPVMIGKFDDDLRGYAYALKTSFCCRLAIEKKVAKVASANDSLSWQAVASRRNTRSKKLTVAQFAEVALILELLRFDRRLFLIGAHVTKNEKGQPVLRPTA